MDQKDTSLAGHVLGDPLFREEAVRAADVGTIYRLRKLAGDESAAQILMEAVDNSLGNEDMSQLRSLGEIFQEKGRLHEFEVKLAGRLPLHMIEDVLNVPADVSGQADLSRVICRAKIEPSAKSIQAGGVGLSICVGESNENNGD